MLYIEFFCGTVNRAVKAYHFTEHKCITAYPQKKRISGAKKLLSRKTFFKSEA